MLCSFSGFAIFPSICYSLCSIIFVLERAPVLASTNSFDLLLVITGSDLLSIMIFE